MSTRTQALPRTDIAAVAWGKYIRLYFQDINYGIREARYDGESWSGGTAQDVIGKAKPASPIAAFSHQEDIHLYYLSDDNIIQEKTGSGWGTAAEWKDGPLTARNIKAHPLSRLAALPYTTDIDCTVFYQNLDGAIGQVNRVKDIWQQGSVVAVNSVLNGTGIAAVAFQLTDSEGVYTAIRVYYQDGNGNLTDAGVNRNKDQYRPDDPKLKMTDISTNTNMSAFSTSTSSDHVAIQLWYIDGKNRLMENGYYSAEPFWHGAHNQGSAVVRPGSGLAAFCSSTRTIKFYIQDETDQIVEYSSKPDSWLQYTQDTVPTGNVQ